MSQTVAPLTKICWPLGVFITGALSPVENFPSSACVKQRQHLGTQMIYLPHGPMPTKYLMHNGFTVYRCIYIYNISITTNFTVEIKELSGTIWKSFPY